MIYTITMNPALDYYVNLDDFKLGQTNIAKKSIIRLGGKGLNVSILLNNLKEKSYALGFYGGKIGFILKEELKQYPFIIDNFINVNSQNRINIKLNLDKTSFQETEINGSPLYLEKKDLEAFIEIFSKIKFEKEDFVIFSGSLPNGINATFLEEILRLTYPAKIVLDTRSEVFLNFLDERIFLMKPNKSELFSYFNIKSEFNDLKLKKYSKLLLERGINNLIVSCGSEGAYFFNKDLSLSAKPPKGVFISSVACGDSMLAGFCYFYNRGKSLRESFIFSLACGTATAYSYGIANCKDIYFNYSKVKVKNIN